MGIMKKRALIATSTCVLTSALVGVGSQNASALTCTNPNATQHNPMSVTQPMNPAKALPKKITITTNCGKIVISLLGKQSPQTVTNIAALAKAGYYDKSFCHRLTTATSGISILQCGDPTATGKGFPTGWNPYLDEYRPPVAENNYPAGTVAMANSGPNTNGSQFFFVYDNTTFSQPNYTVWGKVTQGLSLLKAIAAKKAYKVGTDQKLYYTDNGAPIQTVSIEKITVS